MVPAARVRTARTQRDLKSGSRLPLRIARLNRRGTNATASASKINARTNPITAHPPSSSVGGRASVLGFANVLWGFSQGRPPGHYGKDEHGQEREGQRRGRHGIPIAPHGYEERSDGSGAHGDDQGEQNAHAAFFIP